MVNIRPTRQTSLVLTGNKTLTSNDNLILIDASIGSVEVTFPAANVGSYMYTLSIEDDTNPITFVTTGGDTIVGSLDIVINKTYQIQSDGISKWIVTGAEMVFGTGAGTALEGSLLGANNGVAQLDGSGNIPLGDLPVFSGTTGVAGTNDGIVPDDGNASSGRFFKDDGTWDIPLSGTDINAKVSIADTTTGFVDDKIAVVAGKTVKTILNPGANEQLQINVGADIFDHTTDNSDDITEGTVNLFMNTTEQTKLSQISVTQPVNLDTMETDIGNAIPSSEKGSANGVATLDGTSKIPTAQLPTQMMEFLGNWNATTNSPTLANIDTGKQGNAYRCSVAGSQDFGAGSITFEVGDWVFNDGTIWDKGDNTDAVASVNSQVGVVVLDADDISDAATTNKFATTAQLNKVDFLTVTQAVDLDTMESDTATNNAKVSNVTTNLSVGTKTGTTVDVNSSDGTNATLPQATITEAGLLAATDQVKLNNTSGTNTGDQTSIVGITGTTAQFNTALTDGSFATGGGTATGTNTGDEVSASTTVEGVIELATQTEVDTGTDTVRAITPATLAGSTLASDVSTNNSKVTNATHTGDVTGSGALTIDKTAITGKATVTGVSGDFVLVSDTSDTGNLKKVDVNDFLGGGGSSILSWSFASQNKNGLDTASTTYVVMATLTFPGTTVITPTVIKGTVTSGGTGHNQHIKIFDKTNSLTIAENNWAESTADSIQDLGILSNLSTGAAIWEVQMKISGGVDQFKLYSLTSY